METEARVRRTLCGSESSNTCGYCCYHHVSLTPRQLKKHECLKKHCTALLIHDHPFWEAREKKKALRKTRKARLEMQYVTITKRGGVV